MIEGGLYHVYNRFARGEGVFADPEEAIGFVELLRELKNRDGLRIFAWCLLSNHYHLAVKTSPVPLARTFRTLQGVFARAFNRRWARSGPLWQSRYQARLIDSQMYLEQLIFYIHLNPVRAGIVSDPVHHVFCGHGEMLGKVQEPLVDVDDALVAFGDTTKSAQRAYLRRMNAALAEENRGEVSDRLPWWKPERELVPSTGRPSVDVLGRGSCLDRAPLGADEYILHACSKLGIDVSVLAGPRKDRETMRLRQLIAALGVERWSQRAGRMGAILGKHPDVVSRWARKGAERRSEDQRFTDAINELDRQLARDLGPLR